MVSYQQFQESTINHYERYGVLVNSIIHEISLLISVAFKNREPMVSYQQFQESTINHYTQAMGIPSESGENFEFVTLPCASGSHAFVTALNLAEKMKLTYKGKISHQPYSPSYFEFQNIVPEDGTTPGYPAGNIIMLSSGAISYTRGIMSGIDLNEMIRDLGFREKNWPRRHTVILIDTVTAPYQSFHMDENFRRHIEEGHLSIFIHESQQKFGLLHSDQAQFGRVFGICSHKHFGRKLLREMELQAEADYDTQLDYQIGAFIFFAAADCIRRVKARHEKNASTYASVLTDLNIEPAFISEVLEQPDRITPYLNLPENKFNINRLKEIFIPRASFGHFHTTFNFYSTDKSGQIRLCPNASDDLDTKVHAYTLVLSVVNTSLLLHFIKNTAFTNGTDLLKAIAGLCLIKVPVLDTLTNYFLCVDNLANILKIMPTLWLKRGFGEKLLALKTALQKFKPKNDFIKPYCQLFKTNVANSILAPIYIEIITMVIDDLASENLLTDSLMQKLLAFDD